MNIFKSAAITSLLLAFSTGAYSRETPKPTLAIVRASFEKQDAELNTTYKSVIAGLDKAGAAQLRKDEESWIDYRNFLSEAAPFFDTGQTPDDPKTTVDYWLFMADLTKERVEFLRIWTGKSVPPGITAEYSDCRGATLELQKTKGGIKFHITAVRGAHAHSGEIEGVIHPKGDTAKFTGKLEPGEDGPPCELTFTFTAGHIVKIVQKNPDPDAGAGVYYDGNYYKTGKLRKQ